MGLRRRRPHVDGHGREHATEVVEIRGDGNVILPEGRATDLQSTHAGLEGFLVATELVEGHRVVVETDRQSEAVGSEVRLQNSQRPSVGVRSLLMATELEQRVGTVALDLADIDVLRAERFLEYGDRLRVVFECTGMVRLGMSQVPDVGQRPAHVRMSIAEEPTTKVEGLLLVLLRRGKLPEIPLCGSEIAERRGHIGMVAAQCTLA